ncbi:hypothetical protein PTTG_12307 [Puccinia triticina 1-1 BBBD Race 1]|uniref:Uncharacterized protein n=1 Tax=Puccinia triticina (isolate 1-1 / race 1 (BBBD)) TaxID=630390 RepID=A0A180GL99_PUCT1|nr:hypothetical protein PTTG_12307 [Puccinia triticina 1-1 BBBD Race 1]
MLTKRFRPTKPLPKKQSQDDDEYESTSCSSLDSDIGPSRVPSKRHRDGATIRSSSRLATPLRGATNRPRHSRTQCSTVSPGGDLSPPRILRSGKKVPQCQNGNKSPENRPASISRRVSTATSAAELKKLEKERAKKAGSTTNQTALTSRRVSNATSAAELKKIEKERARDAEKGRESIVAQLSDRILSGLVSMGNVSRDVAQVCSSKLGWSEEEWKACMKDSKIIVYEPLEAEVLPTRKRAYSSARKPLSHALKNWSAPLEVDALSLCITKAGAIRVCFQNGDHDNYNFTSQPEGRTSQPERRMSQLEKRLTWPQVDDLSEVRSVFVHRNVIQEFLSERSPVLDLVRKEPRVQFFTFGGGKAPTSLNSPQVNPRIELVLRAGAVIVPTFDSLFKNSTDDDKKRRQCFKKIKDVCHVNPFVKICLHPAMKTQLAKKLGEGKSDFDMDLLIDFLTQEFDFPEEGGGKSLGAWIGLDRNIISWLWSDPVESRYEDCDDEAFEVAMIVKTMKQIQKECYTDFRRFIIAIPDEHLFADRVSWEGIELMKISQLSELLPCGLV